MGIIKDFLLKLEELENKYKILQGRFDKLKIGVDLVNTRPKQLPDAFTHKPQQPYMGGAPGGIVLRLVKEATVYIDRHRGLVYDYIETNGISKVYLFVKEIQTFREIGDTEDFIAQFNILYESGKYKFYIGEGTFFPEFPGDWLEMRVHYQIYEVVYNFGDLKLLT